MSDLVDRSVEILEAAGVRPFQDFPFRWRVSPDIGNRLLTYTFPPTDPARYTWTDEDRLLGFIVDVDDGLPPNSMLLDADGDHDDHHSPTPAT